LNHLFAVSYPPPPAHWISSVMGMNWFKSRALFQEVMDTYIPGAPHRVSSEVTEQARISRAVDMSKHIMTGDGHAITLEGTLAYHLEMNVAENVAALASCIRGAICDIDRKKTRLSQVLR
jgi:hypothetical protein